MMTRVVASFLPQCIV